MGNNFLFYSLWDSIRRQPDLKYVFLNINEKMSFFMSVKIIRL